VVGLTSVTGSEAKETTPTRTPAPPTIHERAVITWAAIFLGAAAGIVFYLLIVAIFLPETKGKTLEEIEEYFDGDPGLMQAIGPRAVQKQVSNRMGDFNAILDFSPAPKLGPLGKLFPEKASAAELRGEALFHGKAQCVACHSGPAFVDDYCHDLQVERFYVGRPEGPIKTFPLRGIKDSPPYLHDGRLPTLHDTVEFFNIVLELKLTKNEKEDLVAYLLCL